MPTNIELQETITKKNEEIRLLKAQVDELLAQKESFESQTKEYKGLSGFIVTTPSKTYNGVTLGIQFRNGRGIILDGQDSNRIVDMLRNDFGYSAVHADNLHDIPEAQGQVAKSMAEILS